MALALALAFGFVRLAVVSAKRMDGRGRGWALAGDEGWRRTQVEDYVLW